MAVITFYQSTGARDFLRPEQGDRRFTVIEPCRDCSDRDEDCHNVVDKTACWLYDPARGMCPFLRSAP